MPMPDQEYVPALVSDLQPAGASVCLFASKVVTLYSQASSKRPGAPMVAVVEMTLPAVLVPSFKGQYVRCLYLVTIGCRLGSDPDVKAAHLSFTVGLADTGDGAACGPMGQALALPIGYRHHDFRVVVCKSPVPPPKSAASLPPESPLHPDAVKCPPQCARHARLAPVLHPHLAPVAPGVPLAQTSKVYSIAIGAGQVVRFVLLGGPVVRASSQLTGVFEFPAGSTCQQVCCALEMQEWFVSDETEPAGTTIMSASQHLTAGARQLPVTFAVPAEGPASFTWETMRLAWNLAFEFVVAAPDGTLETLPWNLPVVVLPTSGRRSVECPHHAPPHSPTRRATLSSPRSPRAAGTPRAGSGVPAAAVAGAGAGAGAAFELAGRTKPGVCYAPTGPDAAVTASHTRAWHISTHRPRQIKLC